jgi:glycosyltransferase involved in cell wall biosynthesis
LKIAFYAPSVACINVGGVETFVREIALRMIQRGYNVSILSGFGVLSRESQELARIGARFKLFPFVKRYTKLSNAIISLSRSLVHSDLTPYAVESLSILPFGLSHLLTHKYDIVAIAGSSDSLSRIAVKHDFIFHYQGGLIVNWHIRFMRRFPPKCIIACSNFTAKQMRLYKIPCPVYSVFNGVDVKRFYPDPIIRQRMRDYLQVSDKDVILYVGRFVEEKGVEYLIKSMALVNREHPKAVLLLIGSGPLQSNYMSLAAKLLVDLKIIGPIPNSILPAFYNAADIFVLPSLLEPAAVVLGEAQACGLPVVATNTGGTPERVKDRVTGLLVPPESPKELANAINSLLCNTKLRFKMQQEARNYILEFFDWDMIVSKIIQIYLQ